MCVCFIVHVKFNYANDFQLTQTRRQGSVSSASIARTCAAHLTHLFCIRHALYSRNIGEHVHVCVCRVFVLCMCVCVFTHVHLRVFHGDGFLRRAADVRSLIECIVSFGTASSSSSSHMRTHEKPARPFDPHAHARRWLRVHRIARSDPRSTRVVIFSRSGHKVSDRNVHGWYTHAQQPHIPRRQRQLTDGFGSTMAEAQITRER